MKDRVLLIEDDPGMRAALTQSLELEDVTVIQAESLAQARRTIRAKFTGVVLSDIRMPVQDGFAVLERVKEVDADLPVIFLTGEADVPMAIRALQSGVYDFLEKPCAVDDLMRVVQRALDHRRLVMQARRLSSALEHSDAAAIHFPGSTNASTQLRSELRRLSELDAHVHVYGDAGSGRRLAAHTLDFLSENSAGTAAINFERDPDGTALLPDQLKSSGVVILKNIEHATDRTRGLIANVVAEQPELRIITTSDRVMDEIGNCKTIIESLGDFVEVRVPNLRERHADIPMIFENLLRQAARNLDTDTPEIPSEILEDITGRSWDGNLPELRERAQALVVNSPGTLGEQPGLSEQVHAFEKSLLIEALREADGNATRAAAALKLPRKTFYDKLARHGIEPKALRARRLAAPEQNSTG